MTIKPLGVDPSLCFINGVWVPPEDTGGIALRNPSDGSTLCEIANGGAADIDRAVAGGAGGA